MSKLSYGEQNGRDKKPKVASKERFNDAKFINRDLSADEKAKLKGMEFTPEDFLNAVRKFGEEYSITFKFDSYSNSPACFMRPLDSAHENAKYILSGRGSDFDKAFKQLLFIHEVLGGGECWSQFDNARTFDFDD